MFRVLGLSGDVHMAEEESCMKMHGGGPDVQQHIRLKLRALQSPLAIRCHQSSLPIAKVCHPAGTDTIRNHGLQVSVLLGGRRSMIFFSCNLRRGRNRIPWTAELLPRGRDQWD